MPVEENGARTGYHRRFRMTRKKSALITLRFGAGAPLSVVSLSE